MTSTDADLARRVIPLIDHTALDDERSPAAAARVCEDAARSGVAAVCLWPEFVGLAKTILESHGADSVHIATVANFPEGTGTEAETVHVIEQAIHDGAHEIDLVLPFKDFDAGNVQGVEGFVFACAQACSSGGVTLKVILETSELRESAKIREATELAVRAGAHFVKTSTGKADSDGSIEAKLNAVRVILEALKSERARSGQEAGLKVAGGIRELDDARKVLDVVDSVMGRDWVRPNRFRIGASALLGRAQEALNNPGPGTALTKDQAEALRALGWDYFEFHARQRTQMFHFFILSAGVLGGAVGLRLAGGLGQFAWILLLLGALLSIVFLALDRRNTQFVQIGEDLLRFVEDKYLFKGIATISDRDGIPRAAGVFSRENRLQARLRADRLQRRAEWSGKGGLQRWFLKSWDRVRWLSENRLKHKTAIRLMESAGFFAFLASGLGALYHDLTTEGGLRVPEGAALAIVVALLGFLLFVWTYVAFLPGFPKERDAEE